MFLSATDTLEKIIEKHGIGVLSLSLQTIWSMAQKSKDATAMTLCDFYELYYKPEVSMAKGVKQGTLDCREKSLRNWAEITGDPELTKIDKSTLCQYVAGLRKKGLADVTVRKHVSAISSVLRYAGPPTDRAREAKGIIPFPPAFPPVKVPDPDVSSKTPDMEEFRQILRALRTANAEGELYDGILKGDWFCNAYLFIWNTGLRYSDVMAVRWDDIRKRKGRAVLTVRSVHEKTGREKQIPLNQAAIDILNQMPRTKEKIFYWPKSERTFYADRLKLIKKAGLATTNAGTFHAIRRMVGTYVPDATLVLGPTTAATTRMYYQAIERWRVWNSLLQRLE
ncbi:MAG: tyrosine-type recombinase/integrase [Planctomycetia bacterium]|nr:tyrosine-type recombinase/integrase [Planctomycetia bacterium]